MQKIKLTFNRQEGRLMAVLLELALAYSGKIDKQDMYPRMSFGLWCDFYRNHIGKLKTIGENQEISYSIIEPKALALIDVLTTLGNLQLFPAELDVFTQRLYDLLHQKLA